MRRIIQYLFHQLLLIESDDGSDDTDDTELYEAAELKSVKQRHLINPKELNDLVGDLELSKQRVELLGSRLQEWNLLAEGTKISHFPPIYQHNGGMLLAAFQPQHEGGGILLASSEIIHCSSQA